MIASHLRWYFIIWYRDAQCSCRANISALQRAPLLWICSCFRKISGLVAVWGIVPRKYLEGIPWWCLGGCWFRRHRGSLQYWGGLNFEGFWSIFLRFSFLGFLWFFPFSMLWWRSSYSQVCKWPPSPMRKPLLRSPYQPHNFAWTLMSGRQGPSASDASFPCSRQEIQ